MCKGLSEKAKLSTFATPELENTFRKRARHNPRKKETTASENIFYKEKTPPICARALCVLQDRWETEEGKKIRVL